MHIYRERKKQHFCYPAHATTQCQNKLELLGGRGSPIFHSAEARTLKNAIVNAHYETDGKPFPRSIFVFSPQKCWRSQ